MSTEKHNFHLSKKTKKILAISLPIWYLIYLLISYNQYSNIIDSFPNGVSHHDAIELGLKDGFHNKLFYLIKPYHEKGTGHIVY